MAQVAAELLRALENMLRHTHHTHGTDNLGAKIEFRHVQDTFRTLSQQVNLGQFEPETFADLRSHVASLKINEPHRFAETLTELEALMKALPASEVTSRPEQP